MKTVSQNCHLSKQGTTSTFVERNEFCRHRLNFVYRITSVSFGVPYWWRLKESHDFTHTYVTMLLKIENEPSKARNVQKLIESTMIVYGTIMLTPDTSSRSVKGNIYRRVLPGLSWGIERKLGLNSCAVVFA